MAPAVLNLTIVDASRDERVGPLVAGSNTIDFSLSDLTIEATGSSSVESIFFTLSGGEWYTHTENTVPYSLFGDSGGNFHGPDEPFVAGVDYTLSMTPYSENQKSGRVGATLTTVFRVYEATTSPSSVPTSAPTLAPACFQFEMRDAWGDGWNDAIYSFIISSSGALVANGTLEDGYSGDAEICVRDAPFCIILEVTEGLYGHEITWTVGGVSGGAPDSHEFFVLANGTVVDVACTTAPTLVPTSEPPTLLPSPAPTTASPSAMPSGDPTAPPSALPSTVPPTSAPSSALPSTVPPTSAPPSALPSTVAPTTATPSSLPTPVPKLSPTVTPTSLPSIVPTMIPTATPTNSPSTVPTRNLTVVPVSSPSTVPTTNSTSGAPTSNATTLPPSTAPSSSPTRSPTSSPDSTPTTVCSIQRAPQALASARFTSSGGGFVVEMSAATDRAGYGGTQFACAEVIALAEPASERCVWLDDASLLVTTRPGSSALPGDVVTLVPDKLRIQDAMSCWFLVSDPSNTTLLGPTSPLVPSIVVEVPTRIGICSDLVVDASATTGSAGRDLSFSWVVTSLATDMSPILAISADLEGPVLVVPQVALAGVVGHDLVVNVTARNIFGQTSTPSLSTIVVTAQQLPNVRIEGGSTRTVFSWAAQSVFASATASTCNGNLITNFNYSWIVRNASDHIVPVSSTSSDPRYLVLPAYSLPAGTSYEITTTVADASGQSNSATLKLTLRRSDLVATIAGGDRSASNSSRFVNLTSASYDPDDATTSLMYAWSCDGCGLTTASSSAAAIAARGAAPRSHRVALLVTSGDGRNATASVTITFVAQTNAPRVKIVASTPQTNLAKLNPSERITLLGDVDAAHAGPLSLSWSIVDGDLDSGASLESIALVALSRTVQAPLQGSVPFVLEAGALLPGASYSFALTISYDGGTLTSRIGVACNRAPSSGVVTVSPGNGTALSTAFDVVASGWVDEDQPLVYTFYQNSTGTRSLLRAGASYAAKLSGLGLRGGVVDLGYANVVTVEVADAFGAIAYAETVVVVRPLVFATVDELANLTDAKLSAALDSGDVDAYYRTVDAAEALTSTETTRRRRLDDDEASEYRSALLEAVGSERLAALGVLSSLDGRARQAAILQSLTDGALPVAAQQRAIDLTAELMASASTGGVEATSRRRGTTTSMARLVSNLVDWDDSSASRQATVSGAVDDLAETILKDTIADGLPERVDASSFQASYWRASTAVNGALALDADDATVQVANVSALGLLTGDTLDLALTRYAKNVHPYARRESNESSVASSTVRVAAYATGEASRRRRLSSSSSAVLVTLAYDASSSRNTSDTNATLEVICDIEGNKTATCGTINATVACDGSGRTLVATCQTFITAASTFGCTIYDNGTWTQAEVAATNVSTASVTCAVSLDSTGRDYSASSTSILDFYVSGFTSLRRPGAVANNVLMLRLFGGLICFALTIAIVGSWLDVRDARRYQAQVKPSEQVAPEYQHEKWTLSEIATASLPLFAREIHARHVVRHAGRVVWRNHSVLGLFTQYSPDNPRARRAFMLLFSLLMIMMSQVTAFWMAYPIGYCESAETMEACEAKQDLLGDSFSRVGLASQARQKACKWSLNRRGNEDPCQLKVPRIDDIGVKRLILIFVIFALSLPCVAIIDQLFTGVACAPIYRPWWARHRAVVWLLKCFFRVVEPLTAEQLRRKQIRRRSTVVHDRADEDGFDDDDGDDGGAPIAPDSPHPPDVSPIDVLQETEDMEGHAIGMRLWGNLAIDDPAGACDPLDCEKYYVLRALAPVMRTLYLQRAELAELLESNEFSDDDGLWTKRAINYLIRDMERKWGLSARGKDTDRAHLSFARATYERLTLNLHRVREYSHRLERLQKDAPFDACRLVFHLMRCEHLSPSEHRLLAGEVRAEFSTKEAHEQDAVSLSAKLAAMILCLVALSVPIAVILIIGQQLDDAGRAGRRTKRLIVAKTLAFIFFTYCTVEPLAIVISKFVLPATLYHKLYFYERPCHLRVPYAFPLAVEPCALLPPDATRLFETHCQRVPLRILPPHGSPTSDLNVERRAALDDPAPATVINHVIQEVARDFGSFVKDAGQRHAASSAKLLAFVQQKKDIVWHQSKAVNLLADLHAGLEFRAPTSHKVLGAATALFTLAPPLVRSIFIREFIVLFSIVLELVVNVTSVDKMWGTVGSVDSYVSGASQPLFVWFSMVVILLIILLISRLALLLEQANNDQRNDIRRAIRNRLDFLVGKLDDHHHHASPPEKAVPQRLSIHSIDSLRSLDGEFRDSIDEPTFFSPALAPPSKQEPDVGVTNADDEDDHPFSPAALAALNCDEATSKYTTALYAPDTSLSIGGARRTRKATAHNAGQHTFMGRFAAQFKKQLVLGTRELRGHIIGN